MILAFKPQFIEPINSGAKKHTIREDAPGRWKAGNKIHAATGVRTKNYNCFFNSKCVSTQKIMIIHELGHAEVWIDKKFFGEIWHHGFDDIYEYTNDLKELAKNDGFDTLQEFFEWFSSDFVGKIIHWTDLQYN